MILTVRKIRKGGLDGSESKERSPLSLSLGREGFAGRGHRVVVHSQPSFPLGYPTLGNLLRKRVLYHYGLCQESLDAPTLLSQITR